MWLPGCLPSLRDHRGSIQQDSTLPGLTSPGPTRPTNRPETRFVTREPPAPKEPGYLPAPQSTIRLALPLLYRMTSCHPKPIWLQSAPGSPFAGPGDILAIAHFCTLLHTLFSLFMGSSFDFPDQSFGYHLPLHCAPVPHPPELVSRSRWQSPPRPAPDSTAGVSLHAIGT